MEKALLQLLATTTTVIQLLFLSHYLLLFSLNYTTSVASRQLGRKQTTVKLASRGETSRRRRCESIPQALPNFISAKH